MNAEVSCIYCFFSTMVFGRPILFILPCVCYIRALLLGGGTLVVLEPAADVREEGEMLLELGHLKTSIYFFTPRPGSFPFI